MLVSHRKDNRLVDCAHTIKLLFLSRSLYDEVVPLSVWPLEFFTLTQTLAMLVSSGAQPDYMVQESNV